MYDHPLCKKMRVLLAVLLYYITKHKATLNPAIYLNVVFGGGGYSWWRGWRWLLLLLLLVAVLVVVLVVAGENFS